MRISILRSNNNLRWIFLTSKWLLYNNNSVSLTRPDPLVTLKEVELDRAFLKLVLPESHLPAGDVVALAPDRAMEVEKEPIRLVALLTLL